MADDEVVLLNFWPSPFGARVRVALAEKGIKYEHKSEDVYKEKSELLLKSNPVHKKVPVLIHNGKAVCESLVALQYIDETWNDKAPLLPSDPYLRSQARFWADFIATKLTPSGWKLCTTKGAEQEEAKKALLDSIKLLEQELGDKPYFGGESFGLVDVTLVPYCEWFSLYEKIGNLVIEADHPLLMAWGKRCLQKESVSKSLPDKQKLYDYVVERRRKEFGIE